MSEHLKSEELAKYARGDGSPAEILAFDDHLSGCDECRGKLYVRDALVRWSVGLKDEPDAHLTYDQAAARAQNRVAGEDRFAVEKHVANCPDCRAEIADLRGMRRSRWWIPVSAAAAAAIAFLLWRIAVPAPSKLQFPSDWPAEDRALVQRSLSTGSLPEARVPEDLVAKPGTLLGSAAANAFAPIGPLNQIVYTDRPQFRWQPLHGADSYRVEVYSADFRLAARSPAIAATEWMPPDPLSRGALYRWQVTASKGGKQITVPAPPAAEARFRILDAATAARVEKARDGSASGHLLAAALLAQSGLRDDAIRELNAIAPDARSNPAVRTLIENGR